jgi:hypothetical protein
MNEEKLEQELRDCFHAETKIIEPTSDWWDRNISQVTGQNKRTRWFGFKPRKRLAWALVPLIVLLVGGTVYAASPLIEGIFDNFFGQQIEQTGLVQDMDMSQTITGVTVRLERAYADSNVVLIGYSAGLTDNLNIPAIATLTTADGQVLDGMMGVGELHTAGLGIFNSASCFSFDASKITGSPSELSLTLKIDYARFQADNSDEINHKPIGPFIFNFHLPFHAGKIIDINRTIESAGVPVTLEKVVISPYETRAVFQILPSEKVQDELVPVVSMVLPSGVSVDAGSSFSLDPEHQTFFTGDYTGEHGAGTLTLKEMVFRASSGGVQRLSGPWVFLFSIP